MKSGNPPAHERIAVDSDPFRVAIGRMMPFSVKNPTSQADLISHSLTFPAPAIVRAIRWRTYDERGRLALCGAGLQQARGCGIALFLRELDSGVYSPVRVPSDWCTLNPGNLLQLVFMVQPKCTVVGTIEATLAVTSKEARSANL